MAVAASAAAASGAVRLRGQLMLLLLWICCHRQPLQHPCFLGAGSLGSTKGYSCCWPTSHRGEQQQDHTIPLQHAHRTWLHRSGHSDVVLPKWLVEELLRLLLLQMLLLRILRLLCSYQREAAPKAGSSSFRCWGAAVGYNWRC